MTNNTITKAKQILKEHNIEESLADYYYNYLQEENIYNEKTYNQGINQLIKGKPIQYIIGNVNFYGNIIKVNKNVLIPRFETELLVEKTINYIKKLYPNQNNLTIADLGTGSGCIAITLKKFFPTIKIDAYELSAKAISVAIENDGKCAALAEVWQGNLWDTVELQLGYFGRTGALEVSSIRYSMDKSGVSTVVTLRRSIDMEEIDYVAE